ncbi:calcium-binding protein [Marinovum sp. 2_MG-2023]|uniref:calcium-binding protein n=1 Tax=unclassified Marinovum TaxID=2647166 RepID=UPI0026E3E82F|nr:MULTISPECIES: calcium-binding protein [unclassified Marinovum]MDO6729018.1 calcium-binding protein [Marinovum sp. 2_MG-2023]MDO6779355.1 calcium-binding protein [Marinovum sp. 1_MG-2023]
MVSEHDNTFVGTTNNDAITDGFSNGGSNSLSENLAEVDRANGHAGDDTISTGQGNDLAAGDMVGNEWNYVNGEWVYNPDAVVVSDLGDIRSFNDLIRTGAGNDVLLGNGGEDTLLAGAGDDTVNAGRGNDRAFGDDGHDLLNLERGDDYAEGGQGNDTVNAGGGDDVIFGDAAGNNLLGGALDGLQTMSQLAEKGGWTMTDDVDGTSAISQSAGTEAGQEYTVSFEVAANLAAGHTTGEIEVLWNGEVVDTVSVDSGVYQTHEVQVTGTGENGELTFRTVDPEPAENPGTILSYDKEMIIGGEPVAVDAFVAGQAKLYQVVDGQLKVFDTAASEYTNVGDDPGFKINSIGFNQEDDLIYGVAKSGGTDALGNAVSAQDLVMIDASGSTYRIGEAGTGSYTGDFDDSGNLWAFNASLNEVKVIDVDNLDANGNPVVTHIDLPDGMFHGNMCDISYNATDGMFYSVMSPSTNGGAGKVYQIDISDVANGGDPVVNSVEITGTLYGDTMESGMAKGAYGAVFLDGDGNLYYGLNRGDHDLDASTGAQGGIYKVNVDWQTGQAYTEFMAEAEATGSNDGAVDPRSMDAFSEVDASAAVLIRSPELAADTGGNDKLRGGDGDDQMFGNAGNDTLHGGSGDDEMSGDSGDDKLRGGTGDDQMSGGIGNDSLIGQDGDDDLSGNAGRDYLNAGSGNDKIDGGAGNDKIVGGIGSDTITGGEGNDHMWGGNWSKDGSSDTFVVSGGSGRDMIHDFEAGHDQIDLSAYGLEYSDLETVMVDKGWATEIDLSGLSGGKEGDTLLIKSVKADDLDESNFIL